MIVVVDKSCVNACRVLGWKEEKGVESGGSLPKSSQPLPGTGQSPEPPVRRQVKASPVTDDTMCWS